MGKHKILVMVMTLLVVFGLTACGSKEVQQPVVETQTVIENVYVTATPTVAPVVTDEPVKVPQAEVSAVEEGEASLDFEDGNFAFSVVTTPTMNSEASIISVEEVNGSKVLYATNTYGKKETYIAFDVDSLLGDKIADLATIKFDVAVVGGDTFAAASGVVTTYTGEASANKADAGNWSIYLPKMNPKTVTVPVTGFVAGQGNYIVIGKSDDVAGNQSMYLDNIKFLDANGNLIAADSTVAIAADSPLNAAEEATFVYGRKAMLNLEYQGDWTAGAAIPAEFFANARGPVTVTAEMAILNPSDWAGFFACDANWIKPTAETFVGLTEEGNGIIHFQNDGAIIFDDLSVSSVVFTVTKEAAEFYATNGGMTFPGYNVQIISAVVSDLTNTCLNNLEYQGDWTAGVAVPAEFFADAEGPVSVSLNVAVLNPSDWAGFFACDANWIKPTAETFVGLTEAGNGIIHFQSDGAIIFDDLSASGVSFIVTKEAADFYAANGGMTFPGYNVQVISATVSKEMFTSILNLEYQGDWTAGAAIPAEVFANVNSAVDVTLDIAILNPSDWAGFFACDANWIKPTAETFVGLTEAGNGIIHFQSDGAIIFDDLGVSKVSFTITKEAAEFYAANGGMTFPGYNVQVIDALVSPNRYETVLNLEYQGDWTAGAAIPAEVFADAQGVVNVTATVAILNPSDWAGFFACDANWIKPTAETFVGLTEEGNGIIHFQSDGAIIFDDLGVSEVSFNITAEAAEFYATNGGMTFPGYNVQVISAVVSK